MDKAITVLKISGHYLDDDRLLKRFARIAASSDEQLVIVHGGGKEITKLQAKLNIEPRYVDGLRITDADSLALVEMALCGAVNKRLVRYLLAAGVDAQGMSGVDRGLVRARQMRHASEDMGYTGAVVSVREAVIFQLLHHGVTPVIAPVSVGEHSNFNLNADPVAGAIAKAISADQAVFISNVAGVMVNGERIRTLTRLQAESYIADNVIYGGMIPKVKTALHVLSSGVPQVVITDLDGWASHGGTAFVQPHKTITVEETMTIKAEVIQKDQQYSVPVAARPDFVLERGEGVTLYDTEGKGYTDWVAGIAVNALGYGDRELMDVVQRQMSTGLIHVSGLYHTPAHVELARLLCENSFADKAYFCNSGAEAIEGALKFARKVAYVNRQKNKTKVVSFSHAFHGRTMGALAITPKDKYQDPFKPMVPGAVIGEFNDIDSAKAAIDDDTVAVVVEPIQGEGGINLATADFLQTLRQLCDAHQATLVFDEIQCGLGRTGDLWAHSFSGVSPDIMVLAKPLAGGLPVGAILTTDAVASAMKPGDHGSTFSGGAVVMRAGELVVKRILSDGFMQHVKEVGDYLLERLQELNSPHIMEVRGRGLMAGIELDAAPAAIIEQGYEQGLLLASAGTNVIRFIPPLIIEKPHVDELIEKLTVILEGIDD